MRKFLLVLTVALCPAWAVSAEQPRPQQAKKPAAPIEPVKSNPCAAYGAGFVRIDGSSTCVKIGGSIRVDVGSGPVR